MTLDEPHKFVKIKLDGNYLQLKNVYIYSNNYIAVTASRYSRIGERWVEQKIEN